jgi:orotidine-5'-phosphate decarboxylase
VKRPFADRLVEKVRDKGPLCVGIDPHPALLPRLFGEPGPESARTWGEAIVELCVGRAAVVKPQAALFERWGSDGMEALETVCAAACDAGLIVILDAKRGDIGTTAEGYAEAYLGDGWGAPCDAITVNPYMGLDSLEPFVSAAERKGKGVVVLARTSNPGSADFQAQMIGGEPLYIRIAKALAPMIKRLGGESGWSGLMLVAGATGPEDAARIREAAGNALFLVPGYGAQGAGVREAVAGFVKGPNGLEGGVVNASRSVTMPKGAMDATSAEDWERTVSRAIEAAQAELVAATRTGARD